MQLIRNYWPIIANVLSCFDVNWFTSQSKTFIYPRVTFVTPRELRIFKCESDVDSRNLSESSLLLALYFFEDKNKINDLKENMFWTPLFVQGAEFLKCGYTIKFKNCLGIAICFAILRGPRVVYFCRPFHVDFLFVVFFVCFFFSNVQSCCCHLRFVAESKWKINLLSYFFRRHSDSQGKCMIYSYKVWLFYGQATFTGFDAPT